MKPPVDSTVVLTFLLIVASGAASGLSEVVLPTATAEPFCFISHGCWGGANVPLQNSVAAVMGTVAAAHQARFVIAAGDNFYTKGVTGLDDPRFRTTFEDVYSAPSLANIPFLVALGNHDYRGDFWAQVNYTKRSRRWYLPHPYYERRFAEASLSVVVMDCPLLERCFANRGKERWAKRCWDKERQLAWLEETLAGAAKDGVQWRVVVCHYPVYANGPHVNHEWLINVVEPAMQRHGAQLYINADNHYLQVSHKDGIAYVNSGGGGGYMPHKRTDRGYSVNRYNTFEAMAMGVVLHCMSADGTSMENTLIGTKGEHLHRFTLPRGNAAASALKQRETIDTATHHAEVIRERDEQPEPPLASGRHRPSTPWDVPWLLLVLTSFITAGAVATIWRRTQQQVSHRRPD